MKIAMIDHLGGHGGNHAYVDALARGLIDAGVEPFVFTVGETLISGHEPYHIVVAFEGLFGKASVLVRGYRYMRGAVKAILSARRLGCVVAHFHVFSYATEILPVIFARLAGLRVVLTVHDVQTFGRRGTQAGVRAMIHLASGVIVHNAFTRDELKRIVGSIADKVELVVIPHGNYCNRYAQIPDRAAARQELGLSQDSTIYLFFGNSRPEKGLDLLIRAVGCLPIGSNALLLIAGKMRSDDQARYQQLIEVAGAQARMDSGHVADTRVPLYYAAADVVVVPYRRVYESGVALMAMSFGRAVLASDLPPLGETLGSGSYGLLFPSDDLDCLSLRVAEILGQREMLDALGEHAKSHVISNRDWRTIGQRTAALYSAATKSPS